MLNVHRTDLGPRGTIKRAAIALCLLAGLFFGTLPSSVHADDTTIDTPSKSNEHSPWTSPIRLFRKFISRADGDRCPMYPTCSHYAQQAFSQEGILVGWILTSDRLLRCGRDETRISPPVRIQGVKHAYDPLEANTFWWKTR